MTKRPAFFLLFICVLLVALELAACTGTPIILPLTIVTTSLPSGTVGTAYTATIKASGGVSPFTWTLASGTLPAGLQLGPSTRGSVAITGTPTTRGSSTFTVKVTDSTAAFAISASLTIVINSNLKITTASPLPAGTVGVAYNLQFTASGGTLPLQWNVAAGSTLPAGLGLSASGLLSGTPTAPATTTFSITVTDSEAPPASVTASFSLTINGTQNLGLLKGTYAFVFSGFNSKGAVIVAGSFTADGNGNITLGVEDFNTTQGPPQNHSGFTGIYTLGADNRGVLTFTSLTGSPAYAFAIDATGIQGRLIQFDASGIRGSGELRKQTLSICSANTLNGDYAMGIAGSAISSALSNAGPVAMAGRFTASPPIPPATQGSLGNGELDANTPGFVTFASTLSGTFAKTLQSARCTATVTPQNLPSLTFSVYPISTTDAFVVETDQVNPTIPYLTVGEVIQQVGAPFLGPGALNAASVAGLTGQFLSGNIFVPDVAVAQFTATGGGSMTMSVEENQAGVTNNFGGPIGVTYAIDTLGRVTTDLIRPFSPVFYIINQNDAFCVGTLLNQPTFGRFQPQSAGPFHAATLKGTFVEGTTAPPTSSVRDLSGIVTLDGISAVAGTQDESTATANTADENVKGTYAIADINLGSGTVTLTAPAAFTGDFFIVSPTKFVMITTTIGDTNPVLIIVGN